MARSRNFCFTLFNDAVNDSKTFADFWGDFWRNVSGCRYLVVGREKCPTSDRWHNQGFIQMERDTRFTKIKKVLPEGAHIEMCRGNVKQNINYCSKDGETVKFGEAKYQGQRSDLLDVKKNLDSGATLESIMEDDATFTLYCKYRNGIRDYASHVSNKNCPKWRNVEVIVHSGPTGTGKTRTAIESSDDVFKISGDELNWFDGYCGEKTLLIDEYNNQLSITRLLNLLDGYKLRLPIKGSFSYARWEKVYITTNLKKSQLHCNAKKEHRRALNRRITKWVKF